MWIRIDDTVEVITGDDRGTRGKVLRVNRQAGKVVVEQVNRVYKHVRRSQRNPQGGRLSMEMPVSISNTMLVCGSCHAAARMGTRYLENGGKERYCKKCDAGNGQISPPTARKASSQEQAVK